MWYNRVKFGPHCSHTAQSILTILGQCTMPTGPTNCYGDRELFQRRFQSKSWVGHTVTNQATGYTVQYNSVPDPSKDKLGWLRQESHTTQKWQQLRSWSWWPNELASSWILTSVSLTRSEQNQGPDSQTILGQSYDISQDNILWPIHRTLDNLTTKSYYHLLVVLRHWWHCKQIN